MRPVPALLRCCSDCSTESLAHGVHSVVTFGRVPTPVRGARGKFLPSFGDQCFARSFPFKLLVVGSVTRMLGVYAPGVSGVLL